MAPPPTKKPVLRTPSLKKKDNWRPNIHNRKKKLNVAPPPAKKENKPRFCAPTYKEEEEKKKTEMLTPPTYDITKTERKKQISLCQFLLGWSVQKRDKKKGCHCQAKCK